MGKPHNNCEGLYNTLMMTRLSHSILLWTEDIDQLAVPLLSTHQAYVLSPGVVV